MHFCPHCGVRVSSPYSLLGGAEQAAVEKLIRKHGLHAITDALWKFSSDRAKASGSTKSEWRQAAQILETAKMHLDHLSFKPEESEAHSKQDFEKALKNWLAGAQRKVDAQYKDSPNLNPKLILTKGPKYIRVVKKDAASQSAFAFIDKETGDILKPDSWRRPAKHARGNLFDEYGGLRWISGHGPAYLR